MKGFHHLTEADEAAIRMLTDAGKQQNEIVALTGKSRSSIHRVQKAMRLCLSRPGPKSPVLTKAQENQVLERLRSGMGTGRTAATLHFREWSVRAVARKHRFRHATGRRGCRYQISEETLAKLTAEIKARTNFGTDLAEKYPDVSYRVILKLARRILGCPRFRSGRYSEPLTSDFPQKHPKKIHPNLSA